MMQCKRLMCAQKLQLQEPRGPETNKGKKKLKTKIADAQKSCYTAKNPLS